MATTLNLVEYYMASKHVSHTLANYEKLASFSDCEETAENR